MNAQVCGVFIGGRMPLEWILWSLQTALSGALEGPCDSGSSGQFVGPRGIYCGLITGGRAVFTGCSTLEPKQTTLCTGVPFLDVVQTRVKIARFSWSRLCSTKTILRVCRYNYSLQLLVQTCSAFYPSRYTGLLLSLKFRCLGLAQKNTVTDFTSLDRGLPITKQM